MKPVASFAICMALATPAIAQRDPLAPLSPAPAPVQIPAPSASAPVVAPASPQVQPQPVARPIVVPRDWRGVFDAIRAGEWAAAQAGIASLPRGPLTPLARAELYTAKGSPTVSLNAIQSLLAEAPELPQAEQLARLAVARGAIESPAYYQRRSLAWLGSAPTRTRARPVQGDPYADQLREAIEPLVEYNDAAGAEALLLQTAPYLSPQARAEAGQRTAWLYYVTNRDADARRVADTWRVGASGEWVAQSAWISGLASWRLDDCESASRSFREVAGTASGRELRAAAYYWAARAEQACRRPRSVAPLLKAAATSAESFYGLVARETLGMPTRLPPDPYTSSVTVEHLPNVRRAVELVGIGERGQADEAIRHQARIGNPAEHHGLIEVTKRLGLAGTQFWLAHNGQPGALADPTDRYPNPRWTPILGWRVDPALAYGHVIQESLFRTEDVSPAGAVGLMQVVPGTASDMARARNLPYSRASLTDPRYNLEFGQSFIERIRGMPATGGQLPKVIAAYNAGPTPVARWAHIWDKGDPLLWIESLPYWETRHYVPAVLRNMWVYQGLNRAPQPTLKAITQHHWPTFPTAQTQLRH